MTEHDDTTDLKQAEIELVQLGLELVKRRAPTISEVAVDAWMMGPDDAPFPESDCFRE